MERRMVPRTDYLDYLWGWKDRTDVIKIVTGMRRCGKSTLLMQFMDRLRAEGHGDDMVFLNFESKEMDGVEGHRDLNRLLEDRIDKRRRAYVFLDEVHRVDGWERTINSLSVDYDADVYVTGSNANTLSSELSTYLSGRYVEMNMLPLSFSEYLVLHPADPLNPVDKRFMDYMAKGALPMVDPDDDIRTDDLLNGMYSTVLRKDVSTRLGSPNAGILDGIAAFLMSNVGNVTSAANIAEALSVSPMTVKKYLLALEDAFLVYKAYRYDVRGERLLKTTEKYYAADTGMRNAILGGGMEDEGRVLENVVFLELLRRGYGVRIGSHYGREIDFIASRGGKKEYYQVAKTVEGASTFHREVASLERVPDNHPKTVLTMDRVFPVPPGGIRAANVVDWLTCKTG